MNYSENCDNPPTTVFDQATYYNKLWCCSFGSGRLASKVENYELKLKKHVHQIQPSCSHMSGKLHRETTHNSSSTISQCPSHNVGGWRTNISSTPPSAKACSVQIWKFSLCLIAFNFLDLVIELTGKMSSDNIRSQWPEFRLVHYNVAKGNVSRKPQPIAQCGQDHRLDFKFAINKLCILYLTIARILF